MARKEPTPHYYIDRYRMMVASNKPLTKEEQEHFDKLEQKLYPISYEARKLKEQSQNVNNGE